MTLDNARIASMAAAGELLREFPFLGMTVDKTACCGRVIGQQPNFDAIREHIAGLPDEQKARLKTLLKTDQITVHLNIAGTIQAKTF